MKGKFEKQYAIYGVLYKNPRYGFQKVFSEVEAFSHATISAESPEEAILLLEHELKEKMDVEFVSREGPLGLIPTVKNTGFKSLEKGVISMMDSWREDNLFGKKLSYKSPKL